MILPRLAAGQLQAVAAVQEHLSQMARAGFRTLVVAQRDVLPEEYEVSGCLRIFTAQQSDCQWNATCCVRYHSACRGFNCLPATRPQTTDRLHMLQRCFWSERVQVWQRSFHEASTALEGREAMLAAVAEALEKDLVRTVIFVRKYLMRGVTCVRNCQRALLTKMGKVPAQRPHKNAVCCWQGLLGATAVEDRLQEGVPAAIAALLAAGLRVRALPPNAFRSIISFAKLVCSMECTGHVLVVLSVRHPAAQQFRHTDDLRRGNKRHCMRAKLPTRRGPSRCRCGSLLATSSRRPSAWALRHACCRLVCGRSCSGMLSLRRSRSGHANGVPWMPPPVVLHQQ